MSGFLLGQPFGYGRTQQSTIIAGVTPGFAAPVAATNYTLTLQPYDWWRLVFCVFTLTTDATAGNRYVTVEYPAGDGTSAFADAAAVQVTPSSTNQRFVGSYGRGTGEWNAPSDVFFRLSGIWLEAGRTIVITSTNKGAADLLSNVRFTFDRTPVEPDGSSNAWGE
jgi:hypothetical protein